MSSPWGQDRNNLTPLPHLTGATITLPGTRRPFAIIKEAWQETDGRLLIHWYHTVDEAQSITYADPEWDIQTQKENRNG